MPPLSHVPGLIHAPLMRARKLENSTRAESFHAGARATQRLSGERQGSTDHSARTQTTAEFGLAGGADGADGADGAEGECWNNHPAL